ncbi:MAG: GIY-YIG nuclease family protein [Alphaproteobacteria bacterium]|nr:GIY-YIG nuclease family protein [Alphaproteobacteria bacterium]
MKFHEFITSKLHTIRQLENTGRGNHKGIGNVKRLSPIEFLRVKTQKIIDEYSSSVQEIFSDLFDPARDTTKIRGMEAEVYFHASAGIRHTIMTICELDWFEANRPFYNVYPIVEKLVQNTKLDLPLSQLKFAPGTLCFRFPKGQEPLGIKTALLKIDNFDTHVAQKFCSMFVTSKNPRGEIGLLVAGSFEVVDDDDRFLIQLPKSVLTEQSKATVEDMLRASLWAFESGTKVGQILCNETADQIVADLPLYSRRLYFLFKLTVLISMLASGNDLITPAVLASEQEKYDLETDEAAKRWMEERAAKIQGRGFNFGKDLQRQSELSPHWRNPHMALYWTGEGRTKPVLKLRAGSVVIPKHLSSVPTGYNCPVHDEIGDETIENVYFLQDASQGLIKIGRTRRSVAARQRESATFVPGGLALIGYIPTGDCVALETRLHREYAAARRDNEFFAISREEAKNIIENFGGVFCFSDN